nr:uncharacterized mitochondrial protein AtMg00810-like [Tanacetum cinerariifolium]
MIKNDNGTEFKNHDLNQFCGMKGIKREFSVPRTPQQNSIAERKNMTLIEPVRTMLADSLLPIPFWAEAVNTACYVQNKVLVTKPHNKTPYELLLGRTPSIGFMRPFGCPVTILNTLDPLGKFDGKADEGFLVGYSVSGSGPTWLFDIDTLTTSMNYQPVIASNQSNPSAGVQESFDAEKAREENVQQYVLFPLWSSASKDPQNTDSDATFEVKEPEFEVEKPESEVYVSPCGSAKTKKHDDKTKREAKDKSPVELSIGYRNLSAEFEYFSDNNINEVNATSTPVPTVGKISTNNTNTFSAAGPSNTAVSPTLRESSYVDPSQYPDDPNMLALEEITYSDDEEDVGAEADFSNMETTIIVSPIPTTRVHKDHLVTQIIGDLSLATQIRKEPKRVHQTLKDPSWIKATREELLQFKMQKVWVLVDLPNGNRAIGFEDPDYPDKVYKVVKALYGLHQDPRDWYETLANYLLENGFQRGKIDQALFIKKQKGLQVKQMPDGIFISHDKYVAEISRKFGLTYKKLASTPTDTEKPLLKDPDGEDVDAHTYRSMIGSLMYLTSSRPDIMFVVCVCARFQVTAKDLDLHAVKRIFRYLKGKPHLGLWYPKDSPFNLVAYSNSDYAGASLDRKSTTGDHKDSAVWVSYIYFAKSFESFTYTNSHTLPLIIKTLIIMALTFADTHNMIAYLTKSDASEGFDQIIDFLNKVNDVVRLEVLIDWKKVIITEAIVREALRLDVAESIDCLPNEEIFTELSKMGAQVGDLSSHTTKYSSPVLTQKAFANMKRVGKGFSRVETPLFEGMLVPQQADVDVDDVVADSVPIDDVVADVPVADAEPTPPSQPPTTTPPPPQELPSTSHVTPPNWVAAEYGSGACYFIDQ